MYEENEYHVKDVMDAILSALENIRYILLLLDFSLTVKAVPHESVIRTSQP